MRNPVQLYHEVKKRFLPVEASCAPGGYLIASPSEIWKELHSKTKRDFSTTSCKCTWWETLTPQQQARVKAYKKLWKARFNIDSCKDPRAAFHVNDTPSVRCVWTGQSGALPCFRKCMGPSWHAAEDRPVLPSELAAAMGWQLNKKIAAQGGVAQQHLPEGIPVRKMLGNAMHLANAAMVLAASLACVQRKVDGGETDDAQAFLRAAGH